MAASARRAADRAWRVAAARARSFSSDSTHAPPLSPAAAALAAALPRLVPAFHDASENAVADRAALLYVVDALKRRAPSAPRAVAVDADAVLGALPGAPWERAALRRLVERAADSAAAGEPPLTLLLGVRVEAGGGARGPASVPARLGAALAALALPAGGAPPPGVVPWLLLAADAALTAPGGGARDVAAAVAAAVAAGGAAGAALDTRDGRDAAPLLALLGAGCPALAAVGVPASLADFPLRSGGGRGGAPVGADWTVAAAARAAGLLLLATRPLDVRVRQPPAAVAAAAAAAARGAARGAGAGSGGGGGAPPAAAGEPAPAFIFRTIGARADGALPPAAASAGPPHQQQPQRSAGGAAPPVPPPSTPLSRAVADFNASVHAGINLELAWAASVRAAAVEAAAAAAAEASSASSADASASAAAPSSQLPADVPWARALAASLDLFLGPGASLVSWVAARARVRAGVKSVADAVGDAVAGVGGGAGAGSPPSSELEEAGAAFSPPPVRSAVAEGAAAGGDPAALSPAAWAAAYRSTLGAAVALLDVLVEARHAERAAGVAALLDAAVPELGAAGGHAAADAADGAVDLAGRALRVLLSPPTGFAAALTGAPEAFSARPPACGAVARPGPSVAGALYTAAGRARPPPPARSPAHSPPTADEPLDASAPDLAARLAALQVALADHLASAAAVGVAGAGAGARR